ncbi:N-formylglutamate amidohydrolase [Sulfitobacter sp. S190]|uniref:N-formylglutamate amidohydrolase n=1 Tax=Sulfitobacter sp. S190 TaxID=2867022 RepID=UPI0021A29BF3|nr:N-formylglutamate amidohydrolase [Sulfitobacter sp. S190]UWR21151.1 N-formylglutamate amidohydrolase [Sulfitobacter sp. S190]
MNHTVDTNLVEVVNADAASPVVLVCEHASHRIPDEFNGLGLSATARESHIAWDPGAMAVARGMSHMLDATLVAARTSRLVYDCNRPPHAPDAMPARSEVFDIPGNRAMTDAERQSRVATYYTPFHDALAACLAARRDPVMVTIHSFTPVYHGKHRAVEVGVLHDSDARLADRMLALAPGTVTHKVARNEPYGPQDGVTHTLRTHALPHGHRNVMIEVRNDLLLDAAAQGKMAQTLSGWIKAALVDEGTVACKS